jgi:hypothetical protein
LINFVCFIGFLILAIVHLYFSLVQRTILQITKSGGLSVLTGGLMTPRYFFVALPLTLIKWAILFYWAWKGSAALALLLLSTFYLANAMLPIPAKLTLPTIRRQIERIKARDKETGENLRDATNLWEMRGRRF